MECESIYSLAHLKSFERGLYAEYLVAKFLAQQNFLLCEHRFKLGGVELDLLFLRERDRSYHLFEVKTLSNLEYMPSRITSNQKLRLLKAWTILNSKVNSARLHCAVVSHEAFVQIIPDFLS